MTEIFIELTEEQFNERFPLRPNHLNASAGWITGTAGGCLFETYGQEFAFVERQDSGTVWTLTDGGDGGMYLISGLRLFNRIGYLVSTVPVPDDFTFQVRLPMSHDDEPEQAS